MGMKLQPVRMTVSKPQHWLEGAPSCIKPHAIFAQGERSSLAS